MDADCLLWVGGRGGWGSLCPESMDGVGLLDLPASVVLGLKVVHTGGVRFLTNEENAFLAL